MISWRRVGASVFMMVVCLGTAGEAQAEHGANEGAAVKSRVLKAGALTVRWDQSGRISVVECGRDNITGRGVAKSGFALRDRAAQNTYEPLSSRLTAEKNGVRFEGKNTAGSLALSAQCVSENDWLVLRGQVQNLTESDHAVDLRFALPVACKGWTWAEDLHKSEPLLKARTLHLGKSTPLGTGYMALRPVAAIADSRHTVGLVMPLDFIGLYDFTVDVDEGLFSLVISFSMTRHCPRFFKNVPFEFYVDAEADGWGLRSVLTRYYANRPDFFERHTSEAGGWFAWGDILRQPPPICDYGLMYHEQPESKEGYAHDKALGIRTYPYIEPIMYQMCLGDQPKAERPAREFVIKRLHEWAKPETTGHLASGGWRTKEALQSICRAIIESGARDADGNIIIGRVGQYNWISGTKWAAQFPLNLSPAIPGGAGEDRLEYVRSRLLTRPYLNGIYLDSFSGHASRVNYAQDQFKYLSYPPQFDAKTLKPCTYNGFTIFEWVEALWAMLPSDKKELLPNLYSQPVPFPWHRFTVMGKEHWVPPAGPLMQQYRCMAYRKVVTQLPSYENRDMRFLRNLVLLDVFPGGYARRSTDPPLGMRKSYRIVIPMLRLLHHLGWEPVTHAVPTESGIRVERYGRAPGPVCFAVQNPYDADIIRLQLDARALALPRNAYVVDVMDGAPVQYSRRRATFKARIGLQGNNTTLLMVGDKQAHSTWLRMLADDRLNDVRLCLKEYALRHKADAHPAWPAAAKLGSASTVAELLAVRKRITGDTPTEVRACELIDLAATSLRAADHPKVPRSRKPLMPRPDVTLPWLEDFERLSSEQWAPAKVRGIRVNNGRLEMELPRDKTSAEIHTVRSYPFVPRPVMIETDFKFSHGDHDRYLRLSIKVSGSAGGADEYVLVRIESVQRRPAVIWIENHNAPATNWKHKLSKSMELDPDEVHHLALRLERDTYRLELDGRLVGEGPHECSFGRAHIALGVYSGHRGHGDVCWWDNLHVRRAR